VLLFAGLGLAAGEMIPRSLISGGGGPVSQGDVTLNGAVGQPVVGPVRDGITLCSGFHCNESGAASIVAVESVTIGGPATADLEQPVTLRATVSPAAASPPVSYSWSPEPDSGQGTAQATYSWSTPGEKTVMVTAVNGGGSANDSYTVTVRSDERSQIYLPLTMSD
jgi:hypothetical protein